MKFLGTKELETERLLLRKVTVDDAPSAFKNWCNNDNVCRYVIWEKHKNVDETYDLYKSWVEDYENEKTFRWGVVVKENNELIGTIDVAKKFLDFSTCEIGYCYSEDYWGKGYATEALKAVIKYLFEECDAEVINADYLHRNPASGKVMKNAGMKYDGTLRSRVLDKDNLRNDLICCSITKEEYFNM